MASKPTGMYPGAHPNAPGGMSEQGLIIELREKYGYTRDQARNLSWPEKIDAVCQERAAAERREKEQPDLEDVPDDEPDTTEVGGPAPDDTDDLWSDDEDDEDDDDFFVSGPPPKAEPKAETVKTKVETVKTKVETVKIKAEATVRAIGQEVMAANEGKPWGEVEEALVDAGIDPMDDELMDDIEQIMSEMASAREEDEAQVAADIATIFLPDPHTLDYVFSGHAGAGPSGAERWMNCTASLGAVREFLETLSPGQLRAAGDAGLVARQGTTAHGVAETELNLILGSITQDEADSALIAYALEPDEAGEAYDDEMAGHVSLYTDLVRTYIDAGRAVRVESRVGAVIPLTHPVQYEIMTQGGPEVEEDDTYTITGSADVSVDPTEDEPWLVVGDLKYGEGIDVDVDSNPQIRIYALGQLQRLVDEGFDLEMLEGIKYHIIQPRLGGIKDWEESLDSLLEWRDEVLSPALTEALGLTPEGPVFTPSDLACQWCPIKGSCAALAGQRVEAAAELFDVVVEAEHEGGPGAFPETGTLDNERLGRLLAQISGLVSIKDSLKEEAQRRLHRGEHVPGYTLVNYSPPRSWKPDAEEKIDAMIEAGDLTQAQVDALFPTPSLVTAPKALGIVGKEKAPLLEKLILVPKKRPVVAPEGDRRKKWEGPPPEEMFADLSEED